MERRQLTATTAHLAVMLFWQPDLLIVSEWVMTRNRSDNHSDNAKASSRQPVMTAAEQ
jgi:hypothetical protein